MNHLARSVWGAGGGGTEAASAAVDVMAARSAAAWRILADAARCASGSGTLLGRHSAGLDADPWRAVSADGEERRARVYYHNCAGHSPLAQRTRGSAWHERTSRYACAASASMKKRHISLLPCTRSWRLGNAPLAPRSHQASPGVPQAVMNTALSCGCHRGACRAVLARRRT